MKKRFKILFAFSLLTISLSLLNNTYSRYVASSDGKVDIEFAKWQILVNNSDITSNNSSQITFTPTIEKSDFIKENCIAPSSKGYFDINIDYSNVDVSFNYTITLDVDNEEIPDLMITKYAILSDDYQEGNEINFLNLNDNKISNTITNLNKEENKPFTIRVYFEWYEGENKNMTDEGATLIGYKAANNEEITFNINANIKFEQII